MLKKLLFKAAMFVFVMFGLSAYAGYLMTGRLPPVVDRLRGLLPTSGFAAGEHQDLRDIGALKREAGGSHGDYEVMQGGGQTVIYKWRSANETWNYSSHPPAGVKATRQVITTPVVHEPTPAPAQQQSAQADSAGSGGLVNPYSPGGVKKLIERAKQVRKEVEERNKEEQARLNQL